MINPRAKQLWLDALRSGKYPQGEGNLHVKYTDGEEHFCCLGVLCMVALNEGVHMAIRDIPKYANAVVVQYGDTSAALPSEVMAWAGMDNRNPSFDMKHPVTALFLDRMVDSGLDGSSLYKSTSLAELNDNGFTFAQIANVIDKYLPTVDELEGRSKRKPRLRVQRSVTEEDFDE